MVNPALQGAGLGLRRDLIPALTAGKPEAISFYEVAPENWIDMGGARGKAFRALTERTPLVCHGLSLSLGGPAPLDEVFLRKLKTFLEFHQSPLYTEHLSYCSDDGHLYDLLPIPFTAEAVSHVAGRIRRTQDILGRRIAVENASFYTKSPIDEMSELEFVNAVVTEADCWLHLDVNNVYVNSVNHRYDAREFLRGIPADRVVYMHMAGHYKENDDLLVDTHGAERGRRRESTKLVGPEPETGCEPGRGDRPRDRRAEQLHRHRPLLLHRRGSHRERAPHRADGAGRPPQPGSLGGPGAHRGLGRAGSLDDTPWGDLGPGLQ